MPPHGGTWTRVYLCVYVCVWCVCFSASICVRVMLQHILTQALIHQSSYPCQCHLMVVPGLVCICACMCVWCVCFSASICVRVMLQHILTQALIHQSSYPCQCHLMVVPGLVCICASMCVCMVCVLFSFNMCACHVAAHPHASLDPSEQLPVPMPPHGGTWTRVYLCVYVCVWCV